MTTTKFKGGDPLVHVSLGPCTFVRYILKPNNGHAWVRLGTSFMETLVTAKDLVKWAAVNGTKPKTAVKAHFKPGTPVRYKFQKTPCVFLRYYDTDKRTYAWVRFTHGTPKCYTTKELVYTHNLRPVVKLLVAEPVKLKPCPCCGGQATLQRDVVTAVRCVNVKKCGVRLICHPLTVDRPTKAIKARRERKVVAAWNKRVKD